MSAFAEIARGLALVTFALGALAVAVGAAPVGRRLIAFALVLVVVFPIFNAGAARLNLEVPHGLELSLDTVVLLLVLAVVLLAGLVALLRTKGSRSGEATSQKKRLERAP